MSTTIRRLFQNGKQFVPVTAAEAVAVDTTDLPGFKNIGITTLEKVLKATLAAIGAASGDLTELIQQINSKQDKLTPGTGIQISDDGVISLTNTPTLYVVAQSLPDASGETMNKIYVVPQKNGDINSCNEYITILGTNGVYNWEALGEIKTEIDLSGYAKLQDIISAVDTNQSIEYDLSGLWS